ncbi:MAG: hypothetical protein CMH54_04980 [Myxococcales bacterium]|nr:hypothetical protein [Myxococcales bacterium]|tara:strand:- start:1480 stop:2064 length:585 start_codon:yes stop_codon:yes gene_type:complete
MTGIYGVILAAGQGRRLGLGPKAFVTYQGQTLLERSRDVLADAGVERILAVTPPGLGARVEGLDIPFVENPDPNSGPLESVRCALSDWNQTLPDRLVIFPVDHLAVEVDEVRNLLDRAQGVQDTVSRVIPSWNGKGGHPILLTRSGVRAVADSGESVGSTLRSVLVEAGEALYIDALGPAVLRNVNTAADLQER